MIGKMKSGEEGSVSWSGTSSGVEMISGMQGSSKLPTYNNKTSHRRPTRSTTDETNKAKRERLKDDVGASWIVSGE